MNLIGKRVKLHPSTALWMQGDRFGEIRSIHKSRIQKGQMIFGIILDKSGRFTKIHPDNVEIL